jgi:hypothetical protein
MKDSVRVKTAVFIAPESLWFHTPDGVFAFHTAFKSAALTLKPVGDIIALYLKYVNKSFRIGPCEN